MEGSIKGALNELKGKKVDVVVAGGSVRGTVEMVHGELLYVKGEHENTGYVVLEKISAVWEVKEQEQRAGFVAGFVEKSKE